MGWLDGPGRPHAGMKLWQVCVKCATKHWRGKNTWKPCKKCGWHRFTEVRPKNQQAINYDTKGEKP